VTGLNDVLDFLAEKQATARNGSLGYIRPHLGSFEAAGFVGSYPPSKKVLQATQELIDRIFRFSTSFKSVSVRISSRESVRARRCCLVCWFLKLYLGVPAFWNFGGSPASHRLFGLVWSGDDSFVQGTWRPLILGEAR
jgi:hypothetical protein